MDGSQIVVPCPANVPITRTEYTILLHPPLNLPRLHCPREIGTCATFLLMVTLMKVFSLLPSECTRPDYSPHSRFCFVNLGQNREIEYSILFAQKSLNTPPYSLRVIQVGRVVQVAHVGRVVNVVEAVQVIRVVQVVHVVRVVHLVQVVHVVQMIHVVQRGQGGQESQGGVGGPGNPCGQP